MERRQGGRYNLAGRRENSVQVSWQVGPLHSSLMVCWSELVLPGRAPAPASPLTSQSYLSSSDDQTPLLSPHLHLTPHLHRHVGEGRGHPGGGPCQAHRSRQSGSGRDIRSGIPERRHRHQHSESVQGPSVVQVGVGQTQPARPAWLQPAHSQAGWVQISQPSSHTETSCVV